MLANRAHALRPPILAAQATNALKRLPVVIGICLLGSVAREDYREDSDVDILLATRTPHSARQILADLPEALRNHRLSLVCKTPEALEKLAREGSLFLSHARTEGRVVYDPEEVLLRTFEIAAAVPLDTEAEVRRRTANLRYYRSLDRFGGNYLFALAHLYGMAKGIAIARSVDAGNPTFIKEDALSQIAARHPALRPDVEVIQRLRPFYDLTRGHNVTKLPFPYIGSDAEMHRALAAVTHIAQMRDD